MSANAFLPYVPAGQPNPLCPECGITLYFDGRCPNPLCPTNTPTERVPVVAPSSATECPAGWEDCPLCAEYAAMDGR